MTIRMLLLAPPGAGKGTQAQRISDHFGVPHISTGDLFRRHVAAQDELGQSVRGYLEAGDLVPDDVVLEIVRGAIEEAMELTGGYVLDGFPRNLRQARMGAHLARELGAGVRAVIHLVASEDELLRRLLARGAAEGRPDDNEATIRHRLDVYRAETAPLLDYYRDRGVLISINAERSVDVVFADCLTALEAVLAATEA